MSGLAETKLDELIELSPGFKTAVNLRADLEDNEKVGAYLPTETAVSIFNELAENLSPNSQRRSRIISGTYGTGKSHLALVIARIYRDGIEDPALKPLLERLGSVAKWTDIKDKLKTSRKRDSGKFLTVLLEGDEGIFNDCLLYRLDKALKDNGFKDLIPETGYDAALRRIEDLKENHHDTYKVLEKRVKDHGFHSVDALLEQLRNKISLAYSEFCEIHKEICAGSPFQHTMGMLPEEVYIAVAKKLKEDKGYAGILVIWDEFGRYMERLVEDPASKDGQFIQRFADSCCNKSGNSPVHLYLICHRSLQEYVNISTWARISSMTQKDHDEWQKITGRFRTFEMKSTEREVFDLINQVIIQKEDDPKWAQFINESKNYLDELAGEASRLKLFPEFTHEDILGTVVHGSFPLHIMTAFCLPKLSQKVAQNERTMFTFLSDSGSDTLGDFLHKKSLMKDGAKLTFFSADLLWGYFEREIEQHPFHKQVFKRYQQANSAVEPDNEMAKRVLRSIAILNTIESDRAQCTEEVISQVLALRTTQREELREELKKLCIKTSKRDRVLAQQANDGIYRFISSSSVDLEERVETRVTERAKQFSLIRHFKAIINKLRFPTHVSADDYNKDFKIKRQLEVEYVSWADIDTPEKRRVLLEMKDFRDGTCLILIAESSKEMESTEQLALNDFKALQLLIAIPKVPMQLSYLLRKHEALMSLEKEEGNLFGKGADLREEWELTENDYIGEIKRISEEIYPSGFNWFSNGKQSSALNKESDITNLVSEMMREVFNLTPSVYLERLVDDEGVDSYKRNRKEIIKALLSHDGPKIVADWHGKPNETIIDAVYIRTGILQKAANGKPVLSRPDNKDYSGMSEIWGEIEKIVEDAKQNTSGSIHMSELISRLRRPPYGLKIRVIPFILVAVLRGHFMKGNITFKKANAQSFTKVDEDLIDDICFNPDKYDLCFAEISSIELRILKGVAECFHLDVETETDPGTLIDSIQTEVHKWWISLAPFCRKTKKLDDESLFIREFLRRLSEENSDAKDLLLGYLPERINLDKDVSVEKVASFFNRCGSKIEEAVEMVLKTEIEGIISSVFGNPDYFQGIRDWYAKLPVYQQNARPAGDSLKLMEIASGLVSNDIDTTRALTQLSNGISGLKLEDWDDDKILIFKGYLESAKRAIEIISEPPELPQPPPGLPIPSDVLQIQFIGEGININRSFVPIEKISPAGESLKNILRSAMEGIGGSLQAGEFETILFQVLREVLK